MPGRARAQRCCFLGVYATILVISPPRRGAFHFTLNTRCQILTSEVSVCDHPKVLAGHLRGQTRLAVGYYCPQCNTITYEARGLPPLCQSRGQDSESRERTVLRWLNQ